MPCQVARHCCWLPTQSWAKRAPIAARPSLVRRRRAAAQSGRAEKKRIASPALTSTARKTSSQR